MVKRSYYSASVSEFLNTSADTIAGAITHQHTQSIVFQQSRAWQEQISILQRALSGFAEGYIHFEFLIPRMGRRADVLLFINGLIFILEFKVGAKHCSGSDKRQAYGYALDLKYFHQGSKNLPLIPVLIATKSSEKFSGNVTLDDDVSTVVCDNGSHLQQVFQEYIARVPVSQQIYCSHEQWIQSGYYPTPTIIEAAQALYANHTVEEIARTEAGSENLTATTNCLREIIHNCRLQHEKAICFVTGVPGAGKTLVGLDIATQPSSEAECAVFLSGNGPLVKVLCEALAKDKKSKYPATRMESARREVQAYIQNIHHFRDEALHSKAEPADKVVIFDEAQRAWDRPAAIAFMENKRGQIGFDRSEPEFLIEVMDRHKEWCVIIALIGGGQEINRGEAGLVGWIDALKSFPSWNIYYAQQLSEENYSGTHVNIDENKGRWHEKSQLHLRTSMRSFRANNVSNFFHALIHNRPAQALAEYKKIKDIYPIVISRDLNTAKAWIKSTVKSSESCGMLASSSAKRLRATGFFVPEEIDYVHWFLCDVEDVRSSHILEEAATEFQVQGLELDWCLVGWDADYRYNNGNFEHWNFTGSRWQVRKLESKKRHLENAYRVILTRARQGLVIYLPEGSVDDKTRPPKFYDQTFEYLKSCGIEVL